MKPHERILAQAVRTPDRVALIADGVTLTLSEIVRRTIPAGNDGPRVVASAPRNVEMVLQVLSALRAGAAYVPIDPAWPEERQRLVREEIAAHDAAGAFCVLYTSGSTGRPKGVVIEHAAIESRLAWGEEMFPFEPGEVVAARTPLGFVDSIAELFGPLACGVPVVVLDHDRDATAMIAALAAAGATRVTMVPSMLATLLAVAPDLGARLPRLRWWFVGGEPIPLAVVAAFRAAAPGRKLVNLYGATEVSGDGTAYDFDELPDGLVHAPIGRALRGCTARVVDDEIVLGGVCLARGYLGQPALTADRFVTLDGERVYRTGDLGRVLPGGDLQYLGRLDTLVKIRGVRVELGEVEAALAAVPGVTAAAAFAREVRAGERALVAWYEGPARPAEIRAALATRVPAHVIPDLLIAGALPRNSSGKLDRRALAVRAVEPEAGAPPEGDTERALAAIWADAIGVAAVGRDVSFHDLGGTSLAAVRIAVAIREQLGAPVAFAAIYAHPTVEALARHVATLGRGARVRPWTASASPPPDELPLTDHQFPFWLFRALSGVVSVVTDVFALTPAADPTDVSRAFSEAVAHFDTLWTSLPRWRPVQRVRERPSYRFGHSGRLLGVRDLRGSVRDPDTLLQAEVDATSDPAFDVERPPLVRARLVWLPGGEQRLVVTVPHVIADMSAMELLRAAIERRLAGVALVAPRARMDELVAWQRAIDPGEDAAHWPGGPSWTELPQRLFTGRGERAWSRAILDRAREDALAAEARQRGVSLSVMVIARIRAAIERLGARDPTLLLMVEHRDRPELAGVFTALASLMPCRAATPEAIHRELLDGRGRAGAIMRRPTWFHDGWPRATRAATRPLGVLGEWLRALVPWPGTPRHHVLVCVNVMPEVTQPTPPSPGRIAVTRRRDLPLMLRPGDLVVGADPLLARTLHAHVTRPDHGAIEVSFYGGALGPAALDELASYV